MKSQTPMTVLLLLLSLIASLSAGATPSPAVVGWGNVLVPGFGATIRGETRQGLLEATAEVGLYYGGTFGAREGSFTIDGSVLLPKGNSLYRPLIGQVLQQGGLKLHMYDTFHNYQLAAIDLADSDREKSNPQPLYRGTIGDQFAAPFKWDNLSSPWVYPLILVSAGYLTYNYATSTVSRTAFRANGTENAVYGATQIGVIPFGSVMGEEAFFRGFVQREMRLYTDSAVASILTQSLLFTLIHPADLRPSAFASGIYFGILTNHFGGNIEKPIAAHFWVNAIDGIISYWQFRRAQSLNAPFNPTVQILNLEFPF